MPLSEYYDTPISVFNNGEQDCPAFGILRISDDSELDNGKSQLRVARPDDEYHWLYMVAGPQGIKAGKPGIAYFALYKPVWALLDSAATPPEIGHEFGPMKDSFKLNSDSYGFHVVGESFTGEEEDNEVPVRRVLVLQIVPQQVICTLDDSLSYQGDSVAKVRRFVSGASQPDTELTLTVYDCFLEPGGSIDSGATVDVGRRGGRGVVTQKRGCPS